MAEQDGTDEFTPYDRGLVFGKTMAQDIARGELQAADEDGVVRTAPWVLRALAADTPRVPAELRDLIMGSPGGMAERLAASEDPDAESAFWGGFRTGVRAYIVEQRIGAGEN
jgi:hypothetical protein